MLKCSKRWAVVTEIGNEKVKLFYFTFLNEFFKEQKTKISTTFLTAKKKEKSKLPKLSHIDFSEALVDYKTKR